MASDRPLHELSHAELVDRCQRLATVFANNQRRMQADLAPILRKAQADAWDEGYLATGGRGHHEREATNPYREAP